MTDFVNTIGPEIEGFTSNLTSHNQISGILIFA